MSKKESIAKISTKKRYETTPFILELEDKMYLLPRANMILAKGQSLVENETGEILKETPIIGSRKIVDKSQFAKIYASQIGVNYGSTYKGVKELIKNNTIAPSLIQNIY